MLARDQGGGEAQGSPPIPAAAAGRQQRRSTGAGAAPLAPGKRNLGVRFKGMRAPGGFEKEPVGSQRLQCGLLLPNPAERQGKQLRVCLMAGVSASAAFAAPISQHLCWFAGARK